MDIATISDDSVEESQTKEENSYEIKSNESRFSELPRLMKIVSWTVKTYIILTI